MNRPNEPLPRPTRSWALIGNWLAVLFGVRFTGGIDSEEGTATLTTAMASQQHLDL
jgi:hypothetical protein